VFHEPLDAVAFCLQVFYWEVFKFLILLRSIVFYLFYWEVLYFFSKLNTLHTGKCCRVRNLAQYQGRDENSWLGFFGCYSVGMCDQPGRAAQWFVVVLPTTQRRTYLHAF
jgi:hypothetical protein